MINRMIAMTMMMRRRRRRRRRLMDEMGSRYNFFCGPFYPIVIGNNTKSGWPTGISYNQAPPERLADV